MNWQRARSEEQKDARRHEILSAAYGLFHKKEYAAISLNAIARAAGLSKPAIYQYFSSKEEIFLQIFQQHAELWTRKLEKALGDLEPGTGPERTGAAWAGVITNHTELLRLLPMLTISMEKNSSEQSLYEFKLGMLGLLSGVSQALMKIYPELDEEKCRIIQHYVMCMAAGLWPGFQPHPVMDRVKARIHRQRPMPGFEQMLSHAIGLFIKDALNGPEPMTDPTGRALS